MANWDHEYRADAVQRGAALLDQRYPGWHRILADVPLMVSSPHQCVLGRLYDSFIEGRRQLGLWDQCAKHGFACPPQFNLAYSELWNAAIAARLGADAEHARQVAEVMAVWPLVSSTE